MAHLRQLRSVALAYQEKYIFSQAKFIVKPQHGTELD